MNVTWNIFASEILQALSFCNIRGDDVYNVKQIIINIGRDIDKSMTKDARKRCVYDIKINKDKIEIFNIITKEDELYLTVKQHE